MKPKSKPVVLAFSTVIILGLVAWSPPNGDDLVVGSNTGLTSPSGPIAIVGTGNNGTANRSLVVGNNNQFNNNRAGNIVAGTLNTVDASTSLFVGYNNQAESVESLETRNSCLIGGNNAIYSVHGYAIGYNNKIFGDYATAIGYGVEASLTHSTALGTYNAPMSTSDILAIGAGSDSNNRFTALTVKDDGTVLLGKAQGDISMGDYE